MVTMRSRHSGTRGARVIELRGTRPQVSARAWVAAGATLFRRVNLHDGATVWFGAVLRAEADEIEIGENSNVQDSCVLHTDAGWPVRIEQDVSIGHGAVLHGCTIGAGTVVGMGSTILNGARNGPGCLVAAGSVVLGGTDVPARSLVAGVPARVRRPTTEPERAEFRANALHYRELAQDYREHGSHGR